MESAALTQKIKADVAKLDSIGCFMCCEVIAGIENTRARLKDWSRG